MRIELKPPLYAQRLKAGKLRITAIHAIDVADDTRMARHLVQIEVTAINERGDEERTTVAPHHLRGINQYGESEASTLAQLCRNALSAHPPSSAKDGVEHPTERINAWPRTPQKDSQPPLADEQP
jgi:hypothetical protein